MCWHELLSTTAIICFKDKLEQTVTIQVLSLLAMTRTSKEVAKFSPSVKCYTAALCLTITINFYFFFKNTTHRPKMQELLTFVSPLLSSVIEPQKCWGFIVLWQLNCSLLVCGFNKNLMAWCPRLHQRGKRRGSSWWKQHALVNNDFSFAVLLIFLVLCFLVKSLVVFWLFLFEFNTNKSLIFCIIHGFLFGCLISLICIYSLM